MIRYSNFIKGNEGFQYSINIQYDLMNKSKIKGYIPTKDSIKILDEYLLNALLDDRDKASVLIGAYGKGKSHLLLILLALMYGNSDSEELIELVGKIKDIDKNCGERALDILEHKKYLPIVINSNSGDLNQAFMVALYKALKNEGIEEIFPNTYFDSALNIIEEWKNYENTIELVSKLIKEKTELDLNAYIKKLKSFNRDSYEVFKEIFKVITSGVEFNPMLDTDATKLYEEVNYLLKENYNFDGIIVVFDEFSKFIEASATDNNFKDLKLLQDFAELSNRATNPQVHLICITHKTINEYISKIPDIKINAWRAIEGRFKELLFNSSSQQNYELISNAVIKDRDVIRNLLKENNHKFKEHLNKASRIFDYSQKEYEEQIVEGCFPLSPYAVYALPIISEKIAQNERTLFTYLSKNEPYSLIEIISTETDEVDLVTIDMLYDYFESLLKKETFNKEIYDIWVKVNTALKIVYSDIEKRIIKALGVFYIINDFSQLPPKEEVLMQALNIEKTLFDEVIKNLKSTGILILRKSNETLDFIPISSVNINEKINNLVETKFKNLNYSSVLSELVNLKYVLPKKYNDDFKMTRYFKRVFMTVNELEAYKNMTNLIEYYNADGIIIDLIYFDKSESEKALKLVNKSKENRVILIIPNRELCIKEDLSEYKAIGYLKNDSELLKEDATVGSQLEIIYEDIINKIANDINEIYDVSSGLCNIYLNDREYSKLKESKLSLLLSEICEENFSNSPKINNELINKNQISAPIKKARNMVVEMLLNGDYIDFDYEKNAVECTLFRSTIVNKNLLKVRGQDKDLSTLLKEIKKFFNEANNKEMKIIDLYKSILSNKNKIGIRLGVVPIYIAYVIKDFKDEVIVYLKSGRSKKEVSLDFNLLNNINEAPENYLIKVEKGTEEKNKYIENLIELFEEHLGEKTNNRYVDIVKAIKNWYHRLSISTQRHLINPSTGKELTLEIITLRNELIKFDINSRKFIFEDLLKYLNVENYEECIGKLKEVKYYLDNYDSALKESLIKKTNKIFDSNYKGSLSGNLKNWKLTLNEEQLNHLYDVKTNEFLKLLGNLENNDNDLLDKLAAIFLNLAIYDWNDNSVNEFLLEINNVKKRIEDYEVAADLNSSNGLIKLIFESNDESVEKTFNRVERSLLGATLFNAIEEAMDEYGDSIEDSEKRNILIDILEKYI